MVPSVEDAIAAVLVNDRVCPVPTKWDSLYKRLCKVAENKGVEMPLVPLILGAWWDSTPTDKVDRLKSQLSWAADHGGLERAISFLESLSEDDWVHLPDAPNGKGSYDHLQDDEQLS